MYIKLNAFPLNLKMPISILWYATPEQRSNLDGLRTLKATCLDRLFKVVKAVKVVKHQKLQLKLTQYILFADCWMLFFDSSTRVAIIANRCFTSIKWLSRIIVTRHLFWTWILSFHNMRKFSSNKVFNVWLVHANSHQD